MTSRPRRCIRTGRPRRLRTTTTTAAGLHRPIEVRLDSARATGLLRTRLRGVAELFA
ncbi:hypothetical protein [Micromonospora schwarzwaldensis]|uniref:hypothetical protein n=1 Tax=Micromonospora sp. DSM 45708 TaxID=3111767 RepID=UPI0031E17B41